MMKRVKVGVIGVGTMGQRHCRIYANLRGVDFVGVCDANVETGLQVARQYGVPFFADLDSFLETVDAASLVTPTPLHFSLARRCLERGVHLLVEKPITETVPQAETLTNLAETSGLLVQVGHIERFNPGYLELKNVLDGMHIAAINLRRLSHFEGSNTDVDVVLDLMIHDIDLVLDLIGQEPQQITAQGLQAFSKGIDHAIAQLQFEAGPLVTITASRITEQKIRSLEVTALEAYLEADLLGKNISVHRRTINEYLNYNHRGVKYRQESIVERIHVPIFEPLFLELQHFTDCIAKGKEPQVPARDGLRALRVSSQIRDLIYAGIIAIDRKKKTLFSAPALENNDSEIARIGPL